MEHPGLSTLDWAVVAAFLAGVLLIGIRASGVQRSTRDYFLGGRTLPWWAVALSIIATETSAATYIGMPGQAYRSDWAFLQMVLGFIAARIFIAFFFLKAFYRAEVVTVYGWLRERFGEGARVTAAILFLCGRVIGSGVRLYAACIALQVAAGWTGDASTIAAIAVLGLLSLAYTLFGGIRAVVWTECILGTTFLLGGLAAAAILLAKIPGGLDGARSLPEFADKLRIFHLGPPEGVGWLTTYRPLAIGLTGGFVLSLATHGTDQDMVQRMLTCPDARRGARSLIASAILVLPMNVVFLSVGSLLYFYHRLRPEAAMPGVTNPDHHFLLFIANEVPVGLAGLILAGLFAAAVSSHTSVLNALASTTVADFYRPHLRPDASESHHLAASRVFTAAWGVLLILVAAGFVGSSKNLLDIALSSLTYFYGSLLGVFLLGLFTRRGSSASATAGMVSAVPIVLLLQARDFLERPESTPVAVRSLLAALPETVTQALRAVPLLAWPLWILVGTAVAFGIGALGATRRRSPRETPGVSVPGPCRS
jgi:solute:Na+ symporter, SSS family